MRGRRSSPWPAAFCSVWCARDPVVLTGVVIAMALLGFLGTWIPAQRASAVRPLLLLREE
jgi:ABC-type lipoprotein release transport system permease subunit